MPFPVVQPTTVASLPLGQPQPGLAGQQVRAWLFSSRSLPTLCSSLYPLERLRDGEKGVGFKGEKSNGLGDSHRMIPWNVSM